MPAAARTSVFISYSHADSQWLDLLDTHLKPLTRDHNVEVWSDQKIRKGERWRERIHTQMAKARVAIFLVSASFLGSDFIHAEELPPLLRAAKRAGATLLTIIVRPCAGSFQDSPLSHLQTMNSPQNPLSGMSVTGQEQVMASVYDELRAIFRGSAATTARKSTKISAAAPKIPKRIAVATAEKTTAEEAAAKAKVIARRKAIAKKAADAKKTATEKDVGTPKRPATKSATTRAKKK